MRRFKSFLGLIFKSSPFLFLLVACYPSHKQSTFDPQGPVAEGQANLFYLIFWVATAVFIVVVGFMFYIIIRYRKREGDVEPPQIHGNTKLEIALTILPIILLAIVAVPTISETFANANSPDPNSLTVEAIGHQWWWEFTYPHPNGSGDRIVTANEMHIPSDTVVNLELRSQNVLHSFWIPKLAGKVDVVPNNTNTMWIKANKGSEGMYLGQCAEFCGVAHALMKFRVVVETPEEFNEWLLQQDTDGFNSADPLAAEGREIFEGSGQCYSCHTVKGLKKARGKKGPSLTHVGSRTHLASAIIENNQENLRAWIKDPEKIKPGNIMSREGLIYTQDELALTDGQIAALVAYLQSLK